MKTYAVYKGIKSHLNAIATTFYYTGQYSKEKGNTSYLSPAIYVEMPKNLQVDYFPAGVKIARKAEIRIHCLSNAPFSGQDNTQQDAAIQTHDAILADIMETLEGLEVKDSSGRVIATGLIHTGSVPLSYRSMYGVSVLVFQCELRDFTVEKYPGTIDDPPGLSVELTV